MIRRLVYSDKEKLREMLLGINQFNQMDVDVAMELVDTTLEKVDQDDYHIFVFEKGDEILGYHCTGRRPLTDGVYDLYWIVVSDKHRGMGIGKELLKNAEEFVKENHGRWLLAETSSKDNYASTREFYTKNGYETITEIHDFYTAGESLIIYGKFFN